MCHNQVFFANTWFGSKKNWQECPKVPRDLIHVLRYAKANGMTFVMFDHEFPHDPNLPLYPFLNEEKPKLPDTLSPTILMESKISMESRWKKSESIWHVDPNAIFREDLRVSDPSEELRFAIIHQRTVLIRAGQLDIKIRNNDDHLMIRTFINGLESECLLCNASLLHDDIRKSREDIEATNASNYRNSPDRYIPAQNPYLHEENRDVIVEPNQTIWIHVANTAIRIRDMDGDVSITAYNEGHEMTEPLFRKMHTVEDLMIQRDTMGQENKQDEPEP